MPNTYASLDGKVAIVTGAGKGIGSAIAKRYAGAGCKVVVNDIDTDAVAETIAAIEASGGTAMAAIAASRQYFSPRSACVVPAAKKWLAI